MLFCSICRKNKSSEGGKSTFGVVSGKRARIFVCWNCAKRLQAARQIRIMKRALRSIERTIPHMASINPKAALRLKLEAVRLRKTIKELSNGVRTIQTM